MDKKNTRNDAGRLQKELDGQKKVSKEMKDLLQKVQAEFENFRKRMEKEKSEFMKFASGDVVSKLLPVIDNFELALKNKDNKEEFVEGVEMIHQELVKVLGDEGLMRLEVFGKEFDPRLHEALLQEESDKDNIVLQELQPGYMFNDKVLRHAKVKIGKRGFKNGKK